MTLPVFVTFLVASVIELYGLLMTAKVISITNTLSVIMFTFLIGIFLGRSWGVEYFDKMQWHLRSREMPNESTLVGALKRVASMAFITPGIVTDLIALFIMIPLTRQFFIKRLTEMTRKKITLGEMFFIFKS